MMIRVFPILLLLVLGLAAFGAVVGGLLWLLLRRRGGAPGSGAEMSCGKCGYAVRGLTTYHCPECGSDLREVGIVRPAARGGTAALVIGSVAGVLFLLCCGGMSLIYTARSMMAPGPPATAVTNVPTTQAQAEDPATLTTTAPAPPE